MITAELPKDASEKITKDYVGQLEEENARLLRRVVAAKDDVVWEECGYVFINEGCVEFDFPEMNHLGEGELLTPCKDGEQLQVIVRKVRDAGQGSADNP